VQRVLTGAEEEPEPIPALPESDPARVLQRLEWQVVRRLDGLLQGEYRSAFLGQGLELADIREYEPGDDVRAIEWNVTARTGVAHVRQYHEDREVTAWLLLDTSASMQFGTARCRKADLLVSFSGVIARLLTRHGNRLGALLFSRDVDRVLPPRAGREQALVLLKALNQPAIPRTTAPTDLAAVLQRAGRVLRRRSLVFVVSDFISTSTPAAEPGWESALRRLAQRHDVVAVWLSDPREEALPDVGYVVLEDLETGEQVEVDTRDPAFRERFQALAEERRARLLRTLANCGATVLPLSTEGDMLRELAGFVTRRRRLRGRASPPISATTMHNNDNPLVLATGGAR
jgi:uncharacterized protein (DUF58 family)